MASNLLILAGLVGLAVFCGHFAGPYGVLVAVSTVLIALGAVAARNGH